ncbi:conserved hypothetical protein [Cotesia vestalis bracovirus]|nr:conserved hypothetical protein [Cotesia vestalis bracovirus]
MVAVINFVLIPITVAVVVSGMPHFTVKSPSLYTKLKKPSACLPLGNPVSIFTESKIYLRYLIIESMCSILFYISVPELDNSLLHPDLSEQLSENRRCSNHVLQVRERCLPSESKHRELRRIQQADRASERHQLSGTEKQVFAFYSNCVHLPSKNNVRNEKRVKKVRFLPTIYENVMCTYSDSFK